MRNLDRNCNTLLVSIMLTLCSGAGSAQSLEVAVDPDCDYTSADLWEGWGWNSTTLSSCPPLVVIVAPAPIETPIEQPGPEVPPEVGPVIVIEPDCDYSSAALYSGYGWNPVTEQSCPPLEDDAVTVSAGVCDYSDADQWAGFGWNPVLEQSCPPLEAEELEPEIVVDIEVEVEVEVEFEEETEAEAEIEVEVEMSGLVLPAAIACIDTDGDGYGWRDPPGESCLAPVEKLEPAATDNVTDVILMMGQSNALGEGTVVDYSGVDAPNDQVLVWTADDGWQIADLCKQIWQSNWYPARGGLCSNHPGFQIAMRIVEQDPARVVALIPTGTAGKPISWWDPDAIGEQQVFATVDAALAELDTPQSVKLIAWAQGESDSGNEKIWAVKLENLISRLRARDWFNQSNGIFIAQETKKSTVNSEVQALGDDADPLTRWIPAADLRVKDGVHWSAEALRAIGERFATEYLK